ncbi:uncharacterized protein LOC129251455 [Anastrepha obliqua]|uniref:uncharacterized protein LOC129251455 n=1 Tax=Anastrepha obliqua TaxID=95512 RepID=UPI002409AE5E|nr:uncharacterized protein LOC129251455 [Anastrepha obliqua]
MSNNLSTSVMNPNNTGIGTKKSILKSTQSNSIEELLSVDSSFSVLDVFGGSTTCKNNTPHKPSKNKVSTEALAVVPTTAATKAIVIEGTEQQVQIQHHKSNETLEDKHEAATDNSKRKLKSKKNKKGETVQQNLLVKSSFSKFDVLQKRNLIHVRSSGADNAQGKFRNPQGDKEIICRLCTKSVYKMEEMRAEKSIYHKNCFRCQECNKQLKVDNYRSHEGILYCIVHFKLLFNPICVEDSIPEMPRKPELIVRENQPIELPPDVVRASDKPDLGLKELQHLNVRSRFKVFENTAHQEIGNDEPQRSFIKNSNSILSKIAKLRAQGVNSDLSIKAMSERYGVSDYSSCSDNGGSDAEVDKNSTENYEADFVGSKKRALGLGPAMHDIKTKFEKGHLISKEERREERKQEIQNIRSRLFMGKQARFKEMYQQAVAQSEQGEWSLQFYLKNGVLY